MIDPVQAGGSALEAVPHYARMDAELRRVGGVLQLNDEGRTAGGEPPPRNEGGIPQDGGESERIPNNQAEAYSRFNNDYGRKNEV